MAHYTPGADTDTAFRVSVTTTEADIMSAELSGVMHHLTATTVTTVVEFRGLTRSQALDMGSNTDYNYNDKHGVLFKSAASAPYSWMRQDKCEGAECRADPRRINEADMWRVTVTYSNTTVKHSSWSDSYKETY